VTGHATVTSKPAVTRHPTVTGGPGRHLRRGPATLVAIAVVSLLIGTTAALAASLTVTSSQITTGQDIAGAYVTLTPPTVAPGGTVTVTAHHLRTGTTNVTISCTPTCTPSAAHYSVSGGTFTTTATVTIPGNAGPGDYIVTASDATAPAQAPTAQFAVT